MIVVAALKAADPEREIVVVNRPGWHRIAGVAAPVFAAPSGVILGAPTPLLIELATSERLEAGGRAGSFSGWQDAVNAACKVNNCPHWILGVLAGFAGSIIGLTGLDTCGLNLSGLSTGGKTLAQKLAVSCWSATELGAGLLQSMRTTENALEHLAKASNGTVLALDEAGHADGKVVGRMIYSIASGVGKARATRDGGLQDRQSWSTFAILSGECSLENKVTSEGGTWMAGMAVRIVDVDVNGVNRAVIASTLKEIQQIKSHFGHAGPAFVAGLIADGHHRDPEVLRNTVLAAAGKIAGERADSARIRAATPLGVLQVAGTLAKRFNILPDDVAIGEAIAWAWKQFEASSDGLALSPDEQAITNLRQWIAERWDVTIKYVGPVTNSNGEVRTNNREAVAWYDADAVYVPVSRAREAAGGAVKDQYLGKLLVDRGFLTRRHDERRAAIRTVPEVGKIDAYALKLSEFGRPAKAAEPAASRVAGGRYHG